MSGVVRHRALRGRGWLLNPVEQSFKLGNLHLQCHNLLCVLIGCCKAISKDAVSCTNQRVVGGNLLCVLGQLLSLAALVLFQLPYALGYLWMIIHLTIAVTMLAPAAIIGSLPFSACTTRGR